jgi:membrane-associated phospholipid phosphatase
LLGALAIVAIAALLRVGLRPVVPWAFLAYVALLLPVAWVASLTVSSFAPPRLRAGWYMAVGVVALIASSLLHGPILLWIEELLLLAFATMLLAKRPGTDVITTLLGVLGVLLGNLGVWSGQYVLLHAAGHRMLDAAFRQVDVSVYGLLAGRTVPYERLFPLVSNPWLLRIAETAYLSFFFQIFLLCFLLGRSPVRQAEYLLRMFASYAVGMSIFLVMPVAGPALAFPGSLGPVLDHTVLRTLMMAGQQEFDAVRLGQQPVTGFGNFVAFPSLHTAMAVLFLSTLWSEHRPVFWLLLPVNLVLIGATFAVGFHYLVDAAAGLVMGAVVVRVVRLPPPATCGDARIPV